MRRITALLAATALTLAPVSGLAQTKVSHLPAGSAVASTDLVPMSQSCTGSPPTATCTATNAVTGAQIKTFAQSGLASVATSGSASDLSAGTLAAARGGAGTISGALAGNGSGVVSRAACAGLSDATASCNTLAGGQLEIDNVDLHTATGDVAHFAFPSTVTDLTYAGFSWWNCSATTGSITWQLFSASGGGGTALSNSTTTTAFGSTTKVGAAGTTNSWVAGHDVFLRLTAANSTALTCNITLTINQLK